MTADFDVAKPVLAEPTGPLRVFISFSTRNQAVADHVSAYLSESGIVVWQCTRSIDAGSLWGGEIAKGIEEADAVVVLVSTDAMQSNYVRQEWTYASSLNKPILPVLLDHAPLTADVRLEFGPRQVLNAADTSLDACLPKLVAGITAFRRESGKEATPARRAAPWQLQLIAMGRSVGVFVALGLALLWMNPFGLASGLGRVSQDLMSRVLAPLYEPSKKPAVVVVLLSDATLDAVGASWPLPYGFHAQVLTTILSMAPRALFLDLLFKDARDDVSLDQLERALDRFKDRSIPVLAAAAGDDDAGAIRPELAGRLQPVAVPNLRDDVDGMNRIYPLQLAGFSGSKPTAAMALYEHVVDGMSEAERLRRFSIPMFLAWSTRRTGEDSEWTECRAAASSVAGALGRLVVADEWVGRTDCFPVTTLPADLLLARPHDPNVRSLVEGRVVLYGQSLVGLGDYVYPPTHVKLPGVYLHAMALENLLTFGESYFRALPRDRALASWIPESLSLAVYGLLFALRDRLRRSAQLRGRQSLRWIVVLTSAVVVGGVVWSLGLAIVISLGARAAPYNWLACTVAALVILFLRDWRTHFQHG